MIIKIPGNPTPQKRHRHAKRGSFVQVYDPCAEDKKIIKNIVIASLYVDGIIKSTQELPLFEAGVPISVSMHFDMAIPKSATKAKLKGIADGSIQHTAHVDLDNLVKKPLDALNGVLYHDDSQIVQMTCHKRYSQIPQTNIEINRITC